MALKQYGVLAGHATAARREDGANTPHYQIRMEAAGRSYRIAVNVKSAQSPSELLYVVLDDFRHPLLTAVAALADGFTDVPSAPGGVALDFIRANVVDRAAMRLLPSSLPGPDNDLSDRLEFVIRAAIDDPQARVFAFGERWGPEEAKPDKIFGFTPGNGIHDIHMNQGNVPPFLGDDGVWQDGGLLVHFPGADRWVAIFLAFQSQSWHTDDVTGHAITDGQPATDRTVRIIAALVNPVGPAPEAESVLLLNPTPAAVDLTGWQIADRDKRRLGLSGALPPGGAATFPLGDPVRLGNSGGIITLLDARGLKVDGVSYTKDQARKEGWLVVFPGTP